MRLYDSALADVPAGKCAAQDSVQLKDAPAPAALRSRKKLTSKDKNNWALCHQKMKV